MPGKALATDDTGAAMYVYDQDGNPVTVVFVPYPTDTSTADRIPIVGRRESADWRQQPGRTDFRTYKRKPHVYNSPAHRAWMASQGSGAPSAPSPTRTNGSKRKTRCPPHHYYSYKHGRCVKSRFK